MLLIRPACLPVEFNLGFNVTPQRLWTGLYLPDMYRGCSYTKWYFLFGYFLSTCRKASVDFSPVQTCNGRLRLGPQTYLEAVLFVAVMGPWSRDVYHKSAGKLDLQLICMADWNVGGDIFGGLFHFCYVA